MIKTTYKHQKLTGQQYLKIVKEQYESNVNPKEKRGS
jgi:hypothetical protein